MSGFNRSFCAGRVVHGRGVYFAREASYSASITYAKPDHTGLQTMILAKVLVGDPAFAKGSYVIIILFIFFTCSYLSLCAICYDTLLLHHTSTMIYSYSIIFTYLSLYPLSFIPLTFISVPSDLAPPLKSFSGSASRPQPPFVYYDSTTANNGSIFVIYNDIQALPVYIIEFQK